MCVDLARQLSHLIKEMCDMFAQPKAGGEKRCRDYELQLFILTWRWLHNDEMNALCAQL